MVKNIINQNIKDYGEDITTTNNPTTMTEMLGRYPGMDRIQELQNLDYKNNPRDMATGTASDFRHAAAMNELSKSLSPGFVPDVVGDALAYGLGAINEIPDAFRGFSFREGFSPQAKAAALEDLAANRLGTFGTPNTSTIEDVFAKTLGYQAPGTNVVTQTTSGPFNYGTAQAAEVDPFAAERARLVEAGIDPMSVGLVGGTGDPNRPTMADITGLGDLGNPTGDPRVVSEEMGMTGTPNFGRPSMADIAGQINENLIDRGNPLGDSRVVSEEQSLVGGIPDRGRGMPGEMGAYEMIGGTPVAVGDVLGMQQALEKADFYEEPSKRGIDLGLLGMLAGPAGFLTGSNALRGIGLAANIASGRAGRAVDAVSRGLGSLGSRFSGRMRGINPVTGRPNTQAQYEANRTARQQQTRTDNMIDRITKGKSTRSNPRDAGTTQAQKDAISAALQESRRGQQYTDKDSSGSGGTGGGKIVCTMMNERYGFGSFRNKIWMKFHESYGPEYQKGYHAIFLPLVKIAKGEGKINTAVRKVLEHMGRHVTADMFKIMKGKKRDTLGRIYRAIFEPACHIIGKIKSALGRG
jgi:hypothetical protein